MKVIMKIILDKDEFDDLKSKYTDLEMLQCKQLYDYYKNHIIFERLEIDPKIMEKVDAYFAHAFGSKLGAKIEFFNSILADENNPDVFLIRKEVSDVIRHVETYLKMCPY